MTEIDTFYLISAALASLGGIVNPRFFMVYLFVVSTIHLLARLFP